MCNCNCKAVGPLKIEVKYLNDQVPRLTKIQQGDWIDLYVAEDTYLHKGETQIIPLGVAMKLPEGYEAVVVPRSSTFMKYRVLQANSFGVIDNSYCGDNDFWKFPAFPVEDTVLLAGTRICQFRIQKHQPEIEFNEVDHLDGKDRGGFGSTGV